MKVLQISSSNIEFILEQVRILNEKGVNCDLLYATSRSPDRHAEDSTLMTRIYDQLYGHNIIYYSLAAASFYPRILRETLLNKYDIIHVNSGMVAPLAFLQPQRPIVLTLMGDDLLSPRLHGSISTMTKMCAKQSAATIVRSAEMQEELPTHSYIIPSGVDLEKFKPINQSEARQAVGWNLSQRHVLFPYHPTREKKQYPVAREAVNKVNEHIDDEVRLQTVYGKPHEKMVLYYNAADALILPSKREGSPNTVKEAMACNTPVVATDVGDIKERLDPVTNSYVGESQDDLIEGLLAVLRSNSQSDGREHVRELSLSNMGDSLIDIYTDLI